MSDNNLKLKRGRLVNKTKDTIISPTGEVSPYNGHFKTNFSLNQKEDIDASEFEAQQYFQSSQKGFSLQWK